MFLRQQASEKRLQANANTRNDSIGRLDRRKEDLHASFYGSLQQYIVSDCRI